MQEKVFAMKRTVPKQGKQHPFNTFELPDNTSAGHQIRLHTPTDQTVPTGRLVWGALSQALRARLRSGCPYGTFAASSHTTICARRRPALSVSGRFRNSLKLA